MLGFALGFSDAIIPNGPPIRQIVNILGETRPHHLALVMFGVAAESAVLTAMFVFGSLRVASTRS